MGILCIKIYLQILLHDDKLVSSNLQEQEDDPCQYYANGQLT